ncbi:MAG: MFS transporter [Acetobacteraceae bacterium]|nr:MFS transporter [Acetobacteraceae bacterium]
MGVRRGAMTDPPQAVSGLRVLVGTPAFLRLWAIGGCANTMRWFELLSAALFTLDATGSGLAVAVVTAARTMPMLLFGAFSGVVTEAVNRKHVLQIGQILTCVSAIAIAALALLGVVRPWHLAVSSFVTGMVWSTEMATRRRMVGECVEGPLVSRALALDTMSNSLARLIGPIAAGMTYQHLGLTGSFIVSACVYAIGASLVTGLRYQQLSRAFLASQVPRDLAEGIRFARGNVTIAGVLAVTIAMNLLAFPYSALIAPIGQQVFLVSPTLIGILAASESIGSFAGGIWLSSSESRLSGRVLMVGGSLILTGCVFLMPLAPAFLIACGLLALGGFGQSAFANMQTSLIVLHAPAHIRSRLMGLLTVCIGMGPLGILLVGLLADQIGPMLAINVVEGICFVWVAWIGLRWRRQERAGSDTCPPPIIGGNCEKSNR